MKKSLVISIGIKNNEYINLENLENIAENNGALKTHILIKNILSIGNSEEGTSDFKYRRIRKKILYLIGISQTLRNFLQVFLSLKNYFQMTIKIAF